MLAELFFIFISSFTTLFCMRKLARKINLVDHQNERKNHQGQIPLVGGISVCLVLTQHLTFSPIVIQNSDLYLCCVCLITLLGAIDDLLDISVKTRLIVQAFLGSAMIIYSNVTLHYLGDMFGFGLVELGSLTTFLTILAVLGSINAFNMIDGVDGLIGCLSIITLSALSLVFYHNNQFHLGYFCIVIIVALVPYIMMNVGLVGRKRKVFMGDAGSMLIGFTLIWLLLSASQINNAMQLMRPVTALWLIAIPLMDMTRVMLQRIMRKQSPFIASREHVHHIFHHLGFSNTQTLLIICLPAIFFAAFGLYGEYFNLPEPAMFYTFIGCFVTYCQCIAKAPNLVKLLTNNRN